MNKVNQETEELLQTWADTWLEGVRVCFAQDSADFLSLTGDFEQHPLDEWECIADEFILYIKKNFDLKYTIDGAPFVLGSDEWSGINMI